MRFQGYTTYRALPDDEAQDELYKLSESNNFSRD